MSSLHPTPDLVEAFRADLERLVGAAPALGVAVSGGPDSVALLLLASAAYPGRVEAATVDHGLRPESAAEAHFVADLCRELRCPHAILKVEVPDGKAGLQGEARKARYAALRVWAEEAGIPFIATAHHADDQAETLLMRLLRGSGVGGLSGIRAVRAEGPSLTIVRPLLSSLRYDLRTLVEAAGINPTHDPSNRDERFDRVALRRLLAEHPRFEQRRLARSASALAEAEEALDWQADRLFEERCAEALGEWRIDPESLPREMKRRLLVRVISRIHQDADLAVSWRGKEDVEGLLAALEGGGAATRAGVMASSKRGAWHLKPAPPRRY